MAKNMLEIFFTKATRLYEPNPLTLEGVVRVGDYIKQWQRWVSAGLKYPIRTSIIDCANTLVLPEYLQLTVTNKLSE